MQDLRGTVNLKDERIAQETTQQVYKHLYILNQLYPSLEYGRAKMSVRLVINRISTWQNDLAQRLNQVSQNAIAAKVLENQSLACNFLVKEASNSALNRIEKELFTSRAQNCINSLKFTP